MAIQELIQLSDNIYVYPLNQGIQPNIGIITTEEGTIIIDSGNSPNHAKKIAESLNKIGAPPVKYIILTHHHWDHSFGTSYFRNSTIISHSLCYNYLRDYSEIDWNKQHLQDEIKRQPLLEASNKAKMELIQDWESFHVLVPNITFNSQMALHLGSTKLELKYIGGPHADDSIIIRDMNSNILFIGDCFYPPSLHLRKKDDSYSIEILKQLEKENAVTYIHGHGAPSTHNKLKEFIAHLENQTQGENSSNS